MHSASVLFSRLASCKLACVNFEILVQPVEAGPSVATASASLNLCWIRAGKKNIKNVVSAQMEGCKLRQYGGAHSGAAPFTPSLRSGLFTAERSRFLHHMELEHVKKQLLPFHTGEQVKR